MDRSKQATKSRTGTRPLIEMSKTDSASTANQAHSPTSVSALLDDGTSIPSTNNEGAGHASPCIVPAKQLETPISDHNPPDVSDQVGEQSQVAPPPTIVPPNPLEANIQHSAAATSPAGIISSVAQEEDLPTPPQDQPPALHHSQDSPVDLVNSTQQNKMIFGSKASAQEAQRRRNLANTTALTNYEADMTSKDRAKQKEAVRQYLSERVKKDWDWEWPQPDGSSSEHTPVSPPNVDRVYTGEELWQERDEWMSNASEDEDPTGMPTSVSSPDTPSTRHSQFRFENPEGVGEDIRRIQWDRKQRRKKRLADEIAWNVGLQCFVARRDAWTGARKVYRSQTGKVIVKAAKRPSVSSADGGSSTAIEKEEEDDEWEDDVEIPIAPNILPLDNLMRASISPSSYNTIYDKVIIQQLQPSCPMNLKDVIRSCVQGWKRDGEWPPKPTAPEPKRKGRKMSVASLFGLNSHERDEHLKEEQAKEKAPSEKKPSSGGGIRKSIQKILNLGHNANASSASGSRKLSKNGSGSFVAGT